MRLSEQQNQQPGSELLQSPFFPSLMLPLNFSKMSSTRLYMPDRAELQLRDWLFIVKKQLNILPNEVAGEQAIQ